MRHLTALFLCACLALIACQDQQNPSPSQSTTAPEGPALSAKEITKGYEIISQFKVYSESSESELREEKAELYTGGKMEDGKIYLIMPSMNETAIRENPGYGRLEELSTPPDTVRARIRAAREEKEVKKKVETN